MTQTIYLVRHCQASGQEPDAPLTELGEKQATALAQHLAQEPIGRIASSPFLRAYLTAAPLARLCHLEVETDGHLRERVLCGASLTDWRERLKLSFTDMDLCLPGGESSRTAMRRGMAAMTDMSGHGAVATVAVTHGNLMTLLLKSVDDAAGFAEWESLASPDVYRVNYTEGVAHVKRITSSLSGTA